MLLKNPSFLFQPKKLSAFSQLANIYAWINLVAAILYLIFSLFNLDQQIALKSARDFDLYFVEGHWWEWQNLASNVVLSSVFPIVINVITLASNFFLFKSISIGLNVLLELGFAIIPDDEEAENE